jgi:predicted nucleic acid-binding protein
MGGVTYDTGALVAAERNNRQMWALHAGYLAEEVIPTVPAPVLAEAWRGGSRQASLSRLLRMCDTEPMSEELARHVGVLAGKSDHDDIVDVSVVEGAVRRGDAVVTSNVAHIQMIADATGARLRIESI